MGEQGDARIIDGKAVAATVRAEVAAEVERFRSETQRAPALHVVLVGDNPASHTYVRNKEKAALEAGMIGVTHRLAASTAEADVLALVDRLCADPLVDGVLVQLPLPAGISEQRVLDRLDPSKDVDGLHPVNAGLLASGRPGLLPCTPQGCLRLIDEVGIDLKGLNAVVVGRSILVGKPMAQLLLSRHATVTIAHSRTRDLAGVCLSGDVLIAAVGKARLIKGEWIKTGAVVIDVGTNRTEEGKLVGDVDFDAARTRARAITPVPGGVGPMTIAYLLKNTVEAARRRMAARQM